MGEIVGLEECRRSLKVIGLSSTERKPFGLFKTS
jgi:hypothetical protein